MTDALTITIVLASIVSITAAALRFDYWQKKKFHMALDYLYNRDTDEYCLPGNSDWGIRLAEHSLRTAVMAAGVIGLAILWDISGAPKPPETLLGDLAAMAAALPIALTYTFWTMHKTWRTRVIITARQEARANRMRSSIDAPVDPTQTPQTA